jgi:RpiB/LacA/LacB family sugar-phosphate isomerase
MRIAIGNDHGGYALKEELKKYLAAEGHEVTDYGCDSAESVDYPDYGVRVAHEVVNGRHERGILICKSGIGMSIVANKVRGIRAALCYDDECAKSSRLHNDANVLVLAAHRTGIRDAKSIVRTWLDAPFEGGRHQRRVDKIALLEEGREK